MKYVIRGGGTEIWLGGLAWEATKQPIICAKRPHARVKNWGAPSLPGSAALVCHGFPDCARSSSFYLLRFCTQRNAQTISSRNNSLVGLTCNIIMHLSVICPTSNSRGLMGNRWELTYPNGTSPQTWSTNPVMHMQCVIGRYAHHMGICRIHNVQQENACHSNGVGQSRLSTNLTGRFGRQIPLLSPTSA